ncbi:MAG: SRPBCC family protein [Roseivirga sp.]|nr:SRPBCC family protein [Roseivirga sp.]
MNNIDHNPVKGVTRLEASVLIKASRQEVWEVVRDFGNIQIFHLLIKESHKLNHAPELGAQRLCKLKPMGIMEEEIIEWNEGIGYMATVTGGKMLPPYEFMTGKLFLEAVGDETQVTFTFSYKLKFGALGSIMNLLLIKPQFKAAPVKFVEGLRQYCERI